MPIKSVGRHAIFLVGVVFAAGIAGVLLLSLPPVALTDDAIADIREIVIRQTWTHISDGRTPVPGAICFIGVGEGMDPATGERDVHDANSAFYARFIQFEVNVLPVSRAQFRRGAELGEVLVDDGEGHGGILLFAGTVSPLRRYKASCTGGWVAGGMSGQGFKFTLIWTPFGWRVSDMKTSWQM